MARIRIMLQDVHCFNTEDIHGADDFYVSGLVTVDGQRAYPFLTPPMKINDNQTMQFNPAFGFVFQGDVNQGFAIGFNAYDEDAAKDWQKTSDMLSQYGQGLINLSAPVAPIASFGSIIGQVLKGVSYFAGIDQDDYLGTQTTPYLFVDRLAMGCFLYEAWFYKTGNWYSDWNYKMRYWICRDS